MRDSVAITGLRTKGRVGSMLAARLKRFLLPDLKRAFWLRLAVVIVVAYLFFGFVCIPTRIHGESMVPAYGEGDWNFCWRPRFLFTAPRPGDVVIIRMSGTRVMFLKRVVAVAGDRVEFRAGGLYVNGVRRDEPYVRSSCDWEMEPRVVRPGHVYVIGDNRGVPMDSHRFGETTLDRVVGGPLW